MSTFKNFSTERAQNPLYKTTIAATTIEISGAKVYLQGDEHDVEVVLCNLAELAIMAARYAESQRFLASTMRANDFHNKIVERLNELFPNSDKPLNKYAV